MLPFSKINWFSFFSILEDWKSLSPEARQSYLEPTADPARISAAVFGPSRDQLEELAFLRSVQDGFVAVNPDRLAFYRVIKALRWSSVFEDQGPLSFNRFLNRHTPDNQWSKLAGFPYSSVGARAVFERVATDDWIREFLKTDDAEEFERGFRVGGEKPYFITPNALGQTQELVERLIGLNRPMTFDELRRELSVMELSVALPAGFRYLLFYPSLSSEEWLPVLGLWPKALERLNSPAPTLPQPQNTDPSARFCSPFLMDDMVRLLLVAANQPLRLKLDGDLYTRDVTHLAKELNEVPDWLEAVFSYDLHNRVESARDLLESLNFLERKSKRERLLVPTAKGLEWLHKSAEERLGGLIAFFRPTANGSDVEGLFQGDSGFLPWKIRVRGRLAKPRLDLHMVECFRSLEVGKFYDIHQLGLYCRKALNPLIKLRKREGRLEIDIGWRRFVFVSSEQVEQFWYNLLTEFVVRRLVPLGGVETGLYGDELCISPTQTGRYLLGLADRLSLESASDGRVLVQPNFEVVFMSPSPLAEAELARFSERIGSGVGTNFRITRSSVTAAVGSGMDGERILETLGCVANGEVPENVKREILGWAEGCSSIVLRQTLLIDCPDVETAARVLSAAGPRARALNETTVELLDPKHRPAVLKRLRRKGVFEKP